MMCGIALDRACRLAAAGHISPQNASRWQAESTAIRRFVSQRCWSVERRSYMRFPDAPETDASILLPILMGYGAEEDRERLAATVRNIRAELGRGSLLHRYRGDDGLPGREGAFLACSFWLVDALARLGQAEEAAELMEDLLDLKQRRRPVCRGDRSGQRSLPRQPSSSPGSPRTSQRGRYARGSRALMAFEGALAGGFIETLVGRPGYAPRRSCG